MGAGVASVLAVVAVVVMVVGEVSGHVSLRFPPARKYDIDFLDSFRTVGDCGMEEGSLRTMLRMGHVVILSIQIFSQHRINN